jgi:hypothetical protein
MVGEDARHRRGLRSARLQLPRLRKFFAALTAYAEADEAHLSGKSGALRCVGFIYFNDPVDALWTGLRAAVAVVLVSSFWILSNWPERVDRGDPRGGGDGAARDDGAHCANFHRCHPDLQPYYHTGFRHRRSVAAACVRVETFALVIAPAICTIFSVIFLPATLTASTWGMNVGGIPFSDNPNGFWVVGGLIAAVFAVVAIVLFRFRFRLF